MEKNDKKRINARVIILIILGSLLIVAIVLFFNPKIVKEISNFEDKSVTNDNLNTNQDNTNLSATTTPENNNANINTAITASNNNQNTNATNYSNVSGGQFDR